jgi:hypothetical protein
MWRFVNQTVDPSRKFCIMATSLLPLYHKIVSIVHIVAWNKMQVCCHRTKKYILLVTFTTCFKLHRDFLPIIGNLLPRKWTYAFINHVTVPRWTATEETDVCFEANGNLLSPCLKQNAAKQPSKYTIRLGLLAGSKWWTEKEEFRITS